MLLISMSSIFIFMITIIIMSLASGISKKNLIKSEKLSPFECGFDPKTSARLPFSLHFFLIAIIFVIFDVEIALLLPFVLSIKMVNPLTISIMMLIFIIVLLTGLYHEWNQGAINWIL